MKYLLFIVLLVVVLITAGCMSGNQNTPVTPTQSIANSPEPIIGIWVQKFTDTWTHTFTQDGRYILGSSRSDLIDSTGTWSKIQTNQYLVTLTNGGSKGKTMSFIYHPETDTLTDATSPTLIIYRAGKEPTT